MANIYIRTFNSSSTPGVYNNFDTTAGADTALQNPPYAGANQFQFFYAPGSFGDTQATSTSGPLQLGSDVTLSQESGGMSVAIAGGIITNVQQQELFPNLANFGAVGGMLVSLITVNIIDPSNNDLNLMAPESSGAANTSAGGGEMFTYAPVNAVVAPPNVDVVYLSDTIIIDQVSTSWIDEIYTLLYDGPNQTLPTGAQVCVNAVEGAGIYWQKGKCIDASTVYDPDGDPTLWPFGQQGFYLATSPSILYDHPQGVFPNFFNLIKPGFGQLPGSQVNGPSQASNLPLTFFFELNTSLNNQITLETPQNLSVAHTLEFKNNGILKFDSNELVTGINIVEDLLFWTDNFTEPKKINIPRSISGTPFAGNMHTSLMVNNTNMGNIKEEHITVIKKSPGKAPSLKTTTSLRDGIVKGPLLITDVNITFNDIVGNINHFTILLGGAEKPDFKIGDTLRLAVDLNDLPNAYELRVNILNINEANNSTSYSVETMSISDTAPVNNPNKYYVALEEEGGNLFERKFPRFAYRYKYIDNEYSTFSPFTNPAFEPGNFNYEPIKAYNEGMTNTIKTLKIQDFITKDIPSDVTQVDILYKNETSPNIYLMDSVRKEDFPLEGATTNVWNSAGSSNHYNAPKGSYDVATENIYSTLPSNQSLRSWDNVPRKALAQEITGNRVIYGNYTQGYDVKEIENQTNQLTPDLDITVRSRGRQDTRDAMPSIKSLRNYDIGVVWGDKYGRETPVITPSSGSIVVKKDKAVQSSYFSAELKNAPYWADYYRFYIKETSNEYYNLAVDRVYDAADGNIWVSFPSGDRNKVDEDTYIILKKGADSNDSIIDEARYKILSIENNAPDYIKTIYELLVKTNTDNSRPKSACNMFNGSFVNNACTIFPDPLSSGNFPTVNRKDFTISYGHWTDPYSTLSANETMGLTNLKNLYSDTIMSGDKLFVSFSKEPTDSDGVTTVITGSKYQVTAVDMHFQNAVVNPGTWDPATQTIDFYRIKLATPILTTDEFVTSGLSATAGTANYNNPPGDNVHIHFWKQSVENKPEFDGRFFVKIHSNSLDRQRFTNDPGDNRKWIIAASTEINLIDDTSLADEMSVSSGDYNYNENHVSTVEISNDPDNTFQKWYNTNSLTRTKSQWDEILKFGTGLNQARWFIDKASFASIVPPGENRYYSQDPDFGYYPATQNVPNTITTINYTTEIGGVDIQWDSSDISSVQDWGVDLANPVTTNVFTHRKNGDIVDAWSVPVNSTHDYCNNQITRTNHTWIDGEQQPGPTFSGQQISTGLGGLLGTSFSGSGNDFVPVRDWWGGLDSLRQQQDPGGSGAGLFPHVIGTRAYNVDNKAADTNKYNFPPSWSADNGVAISNYGYTAILDVGGNDDPSRSKWMSNTNADAIDLDIGSGLSNGIIGMKGVWNKTTGTTTKYYIDIAYSKLGPDSKGATHCSGNGRNDFYDVNWGVGVGEDNTATSAENAVVTNLAPNKRFKFKDSQAIYKIKSVHKRKLFNYMGLKTSYIPRFHMKWMRGTPGGDNEFRNYDEFWNENHVEQQKIMGLASNRRLSYRIEYELDVISSPNGTDPTIVIDSPDEPYNNITNKAMTGLTAGASPAILNHEEATLEFLEQYEDEVNKISKNPAIFETEPKEDADLELYYEASSSIPVDFVLTNKNKFDYIPIGSILMPPAGFTGLDDGIFVTGWNEFDEGTIDPNTGLIDPASITVFPTVSLSSFINGNQRAALSSQGYYSFLKDDGTIVISSIVTPTQTVIAVGPGGNVISSTAAPSTGLIVKNTNIVGLSWHNCWSFGNGVESNRIGDTYNKPFLQNGVTLSSIVEEDFKEEQRKNGLIYSGIYNSNSGVNNLNQFIQAEKITKDLNPTYGSIQKLYSKGSADGDLIALCEDRILKILANKDALFNADGKPQLISSSNVLGEAMPYSGSYGISKNPESFASQSYRVYFADKVRGSIIRLSKDGLTAISGHGMKDWFRDNLKLGSKLIGSCDDKKNEYNITALSEVVNGTAATPHRTVTFREDIRGWVSFKSFTPENAISCANEYYSFQGGNLWKHHDETVDRNTFYNNFTPTSLRVIMNDMPNIVKTFHTINYEGSQSNVNARTSYDTYDVTSWNGTFDSITGLPVYTAITGNNFDNNYYNLENKKGWYSENIVTNLENGSINEFIEKEGKWFNYIKGKK